MADYISLRKGRNIVSTILHVVLNILLGFGSIAATIITGNWIIGILLVIISKWRVFAVRPRFWLTNLKANLVDFIVGASFVFIAFGVGTTVLPVHWLLAIGYTLWLIFLKPRSSELATEIQALAAVFLGVCAASFLLAQFDSIWLVLATFVIGFAASRHVLIQNDDPHSSTLTLITGLIMAEIAWLCHSWLIVYRFSTTGIIVPQLAIILTVIAFLFMRIYNAIMKRDGILKLSDIAAPLFFSLALIAIIVIAFSKPIFNI